MILREGEHEVVRRIACENCTCEWEGFCSVCLDKGYAVILDPIKCATAFGYCGA